MIYQQRELLESFKILSEAGYLIKEDEGADAQLGFIIDNIIKDVKHYRMDYFTFKKYLTKEGWTIDHGVQPGMMGSNKGYVDAWINVYNNAEGNDNCIQFKLECDPKTKEITVTEWVDVTDGSDED